MQRRLIFLFWVRGNVVVDGSPPVHRQAERSARRHARRRECASKILVAILEKPVRSRRSNESQLYDEVRPAQLSRAMKSFCRAVSAFTSTKPRCPNLEFFLPEGVHVVHPACLGQRPGRRAAYRDHKTFHH
jgi:hypothetical protein